MKPIERRLRALEAKVNYKPLKPPRRVIVGVGETLEAVLTREGIGTADGVIVRKIIAPKMAEIDNALPIGAGA